MRRRETFYSPIHPSQRYPPPSPCSTTISAAIFDNTRNHFGFLGLPSLHHQIGAQNPKHLPIASLTLAVSLTPDGHWQDHPSSTPPIAWGTVPPTPSNSQTNLSTATPLATVPSLHSSLPLYLAPRSPCGLPLHMLGIL